MTVPTENAAAGPDADLPSRPGQPERDGLDGPPPGAILTGEQRRFLAVHTRGFLIVTGADGGPIGYPMTVGWHDGTLEFNTYRRSAKVAHLRRDGRVCVVVVPRDRAAERRVLSVWGRVQPGEGSIEHWMRDGDAPGPTPDLSAPPHATPPHATPPHVVRKVQERLLDGRRIIIRVTPITALFMQDTEGADTEGADTEKVDTEGAGDAG